MAKHSKAEIATKLAQADKLATQGKLQRDIASTLGVSLMTLHRWRRTSPGSESASKATPEMGQSDRMPEENARLAELRLENSRLRQLVTDLLLEKMKLEEEASRSHQLPIRQAYR